MNGAFKRHMGRFLAALMLMLLLCPAALADEQTADTWYFGGEGQDMVYNATPLPNGCLLLNGYTHPSRAGQAGTASRQTRAWLLCLNPDMSIAWEVIDTAEGTTRYVVPQVLPDGRISVLYYNSPSQVTEEVAIRYFTQNGEPAGETPLPAEPPFELPGDRCADGYLFTITDTGSVFANESGLHSLPPEQEIAFIGKSTDSVLATGDGQIIVGTRRGAQRRAAVAYIDAEGNERWCFSPDEYAQGVFACPFLLEDGSLIFSWSLQASGTGETAQMRILCLDENGSLLWERPMPADLGPDFTPVDDGYVFCRYWLEKTYMRVCFTQVDPNGRVTGIWEAEPRQENGFGEQLFTWNGGVWLLTNVERLSKRENDRQEASELQDVALIRMNACEPVAE